MNLTLAGSNPGGLVAHMVMDTVAQTIDASSRCVCECSRFYALKFARPGTCRPWALSHGGISYVVVPTVSKREGENEDLPV
jgi:hypothetical protein